MGKSLLTPKEVASLLRISVATVNYYTNLGLLLPQERRGNMRLYSRDRTLRSFAKIKELRMQGYSLKLICQQLRG